VPQKGAEVLKGRGRNGKTQSDDGFIKPVDDLSNRTPADLVAMAIETTEIAAETRHVSDERTCERGGELAWTWD
jgi:hypothetical protein